MAAIRRIDPLTDMRWRHFVEAAPQGWVCHMPERKQVLEESFPHMHGHCIVKEVTHTSVIKAALPLFEVRSRLIGNRLVSIPFATLSDPLASTKEDLDDLLSAALDLARERNCTRIEIRTTETADLFQDSRFVKSCDFVRHVLRLDAAPDELKKRFHRSCVRQRIDRALSHGFNVFAATGELHIRQFERLHALTRKRLGLPPQPARFFRALFDRFSRSGRVTLIVATLRDRIVGGLILLHHGHRCSAEVIAEDIQYRNVSLPHLLFWEAIKFSCEAGYATFDFGRTAITNTTLMDFKSRWATTAEPLPQFCCCTGRTKCAPRFGREPSVQALLASVIKSCPMPVARLIGHFCYQHIG